MQTAVQRNPEARAGGTEGDVNPSVSGPDHVPWV